MGVVYVLVNSAFENYLKIGRTTNLEQRLWAATLLLAATRYEDIEGVIVKTAQRVKQLPTLPIPNSANTPKPTQAAPTPQVSQQDFEPIQAIKPIAPK